MTALRQCAATATRAYSHRCVVTYHSQFCKVECETAAGIPILPLRQMGAGPAPKSDESVDIIDEAITLFRSTILFKNFSPKGPADKIIVYLTVFI